MRTIIYGVTDLNKNKTVATGMDNVKAEALLTKLRESNPMGNYRVTYKWVNI